MSSHHKLLIIGSGPSGYTAALYAARAQFAPLVLTGEKHGGQLMWTTEVENFPGFPEGIMGPQLMLQMRQQAERFGAQLVDKYVTAVDFSQRPFKIWTQVPPGATGEQFEKSSPEELDPLLSQIRAGEPDYTADAVILSTGAVARMMKIPGEHEFLGRGVSTCAVCDAAFYRDRVTFVVGGGDSAMEDTLALTKFAKSVTVLHRRDSFRASKIMQERVLNHPKVKVLWNTAIKEIKGDKMVGSIVIETDGKQQELPADGVFLAIGHNPVSALFAGQIQLDAHGYIVTRQSASKPGVEAAQAALDDKGLLLFPTMTSVEGVFAAGDVVDIRYRQAITSAGQGCSAALDAERWLESQVV